MVLTVDKEAVMRDVAMSTAYAGDKMVEEGDAYKRVATIDEDSDMLEQFWQECRGEVVRELMGVICEERELAGRYEIELDGAGRPAPTLRASMELDLHRYFVTGISGRWYVYTNKGEAGLYADKARMLLDELHRKAVYRSAPERPRYGN